jgi:hypothetical protein
MEEEEEEEKVQWRMNAVGGIELINIKIDKINIKKKEKTTQTVPFTVDFTTVQEIKEHKELKNIIDELKGLFSKYGTVDGVDWKMYKFDGKEWKEDKQDADGK